MLERRRFETETQTVKGFTKENSCPEDFKTSAEKANQKLKESRFSQLDSLEGDVPTSFYQTL